MVPPSRETLAAPDSPVCACARGGYSTLCEAGSMRRREADAELSKKTTTRSDTTPAFAVDGAAQLDAFRRDGFAVVPGLFGAEEIARISAWTDELERLPEVPGRAMKYFEPSLLRAGERVLQRIENFCPFHDGLAALCDGEALRGSVSRLLGETAVLFKDKINFKLPGGDGFKPHQDQQAGWSAYAELFVTAMVSIDGTTEANGCLELCAGHHTRGLLGEEWKPLTDEDMRRLGVRPVPTRPGDAVFFDSYTPHASGPNLTAERRRVLYITFNRRSAGDHRARYYADKRKSFPPDIERDPNRTYTFRV
jgi:ectoine hydroxylase-related dioxygenase (phytanoyl-CoA dioxygenase family)